MQVYLRTLGCRLNEAELQTWSQQFIDTGYEISNKLDKADVMILNTCAVTGEAARKSRQILRRMHRENTSAKLVVTGCYASLDESEAAEILGVDLVIPNSKKDHLVELINEQFRLDGELLPTMPAFATEPGEAALFIRNRDRAFIKIQDGCRYKCSYCIVTKARGSEKSRTISHIVKEINGLSVSGVNEVVLTGVHVGGYGSDLGVTLKDLIEAILLDSDIKRVRFASVEPWDLPEGFFNLFDNKRLMPHMHLPLQSGSNTVLRRMSRRCNQQSFLSIMQQARKYVSGFNATTDIIVGFPGETDYEWQESLEFIQRIGFGHVHIFSYSHREGTRAAKLEQQLSSAVKKQRSKELTVIAKTMKSAALQKMIGQKVEVLWESGVKQVSQGRFNYSGYTPNYHRVNVELAGDATRQILPVTLQQLSSDESMLVGDVELSIQSRLTPLNSSKTAPLISVKQL
ncbi:MAG: tRNA (N(6)-L-threonylcarbamoyladenosine(37)-C(2))-methylthiotransferase MtaB [Gammaproteobacteria bacterium]|nr:MAG: tRNA (N(6)-L-threonylcarbamoyladenosine(37)-C(2))-methylthiotransferase MtaB [Gammaproteobacteria bacterium]